MKKLVLIAAVGGMIVFMIILNVVIIFQMKHKPKTAPIVSSVSALMSLIRASKPWLRWMID